LDSYATLPAEGTRGGIVIACSQDRYTLQHVDTRIYSVTVQITRRVDNPIWFLIAVYGPQTETDKISCIQELKLIRQITSGRWLLLGDFNLVCRAEDKNRGSVNRRLLNSFRSVIDELKVKEIHLQGRRYTWSSGTAAPTQTKIDHVFATRDWELLYGDCHLQAGGTSVSDHCPMILICAPYHRKYKGFRFEACWLRMPDFREKVAQSGQLRFHPQTGLGFCISSWLD
jgi:exonuclease III